MEARHCHLKRVIPFPSCPRTRIALLKRVIPLPRQVSAQAKGGHCHLERARVEGSDKGPRLRTLIGLIKALKPKL